MRSLRFPVAVATAVTALTTASILFTAGVTSQAAVAKTTVSCQLSGLDIWLNTQGNGAAGSSYYQLEFTNLSGHPCTTSGYPQVLATTLNGAQLGSSSSTNPVHAPQLVHLANGATATATLRIVEAGNFSSSACHLATSAGLRVFLPTASGRAAAKAASKFVPFPFSGCSRPGPHILSVAAVQGT